jgi:ketosteroid isomerase-like protein
MRADMAFAAAVPRSIESMEVRVSGDVAWVVAVSSTVGEYRGRAINSRGAELMVLTRSADGWKISAIHWSSRAVRTGDTQARRIGID